MPQSPLVAAIALSGGQPKLAGLNKDGGLSVSSSNLAASLGGVLGVCANQTGAALSAGLATTYTGLVLSNPAASTKNLILLEAAGVINVAAAALTGIGLIAGWAAGGIVTHTTPLVPRSGLIGGGVILLNGLVDAAATLVGASVNAPGWIDWLQEMPPATNGINFSKKYTGEIVIPPGGYVAIGASIAGPAAGLLGSFKWLEIAP